MRVTDAEITSRGGYNAALNQAISAAALKGVMSKGATEADVMSFAKSGEGSATMAADEFEKGNYVRATLEMLSGVAYLIPGVGTMASAAIDTGLLLTQDNNNPKTPKEKAMDMVYAASADSQTVGATAVGEMAIVSQGTQGELVATGATPHTFS